MAGKTILVLNGPNLNMLGSREPAIYGEATLADIEAECRKAAASADVELDFRQSNDEGTLIDWIHESVGSAYAIVINAGAYAHTSIALHDALKLTGMPVIEVHLSNIYKREEFRHHSYLSTVANGVICGLGPQGYVFAIAAASRLIG